MKCQLKWNMVIEINCINKNMSHRRRQNTKNQIWNIMSENYGFIGFYGDDEINLVQQKKTSLARI